MSSRLRAASVAAALLAVFATSGCGGKKEGASRGSSSRVGSDLAEEELFAKGKELLDRGKNDEARSYLRRYEQRYPRGPHIEEVKILIADSFFKASELDQQVEGVALYRQFLTFYPQHPLACTAQYRIGEYHLKQMRSCERDQSETQLAVHEFQLLLQTYPACSLAEEARRSLDNAYDRLACAELRVAEFYRRTGEPDAARHRLEDLLKAYPRFAQRCYAQRLLVELLDSGKDAEQMRTVLARMAEECKGSEELGRAEKRAGFSARETGGAPDGGEGAAPGTKGPKADAAAGSGEPRPDGKKPAPEGGE